MPLGMELGLGPEDFVLDGDPWQPPPRKRGGGTAPIFGPCLLWPNDWMGQYETWYGGRPRIRRYYVRLGPSSPQEKKERKEVYLYSAFIVATTLKALRRGSHSFTCKTPIFGPCLLWPNGWMDQDATW